jgi:hypothetical protein
MVGYFKNQIRTFFRVAKLLAKTWCTRAFWRADYLQLGFLLVVILFWWRQSEGVLHGASPLFGWVISAEVAICLLTAIAWSGFRLASNDATRHTLAMALLQFFAIIVGNTIVAVLIVVRGAELKPPDALIFTSSVICIIILGCFIAAKKLTYNSAWAKCWYSVSLKAAPQVVQAAWLVMGMGVLDAWSVVFLVLQGTGRFMLAQKAWHQAPVDSPQQQNNAKALRVGTGLDLLTILMVAIGAVINAAS